MNPSSDRPLTFALVGCGSIAPTQAKALASLVGDARLTHVCDLDADRAAKLAREHGAAVASLEAILADPTIDALTVCTPSGAHADIAVPALRAGKHVVVEKPMEVSLAACDRIVAARRESGRQFAVISQHRFDPSSQLVREIIDQGRLGRLHLADVRVPWFRTQEYYDSGDWRGTWALDGGGCLMNQGVHTVDLMLWLFGPVRSVYAQARTAVHERIEVEDTVVATLTFASGAIGNLLAATSCYPGFPVRLGVHGTEGSAVIEGDELHTLAIRGEPVRQGGPTTAHALQVATGGTRSAVAHAAADAGAKPEVWRWGDAHRAQFLDFIQAIRGGRPPLVDDAAGRRAVELISAVYTSARTGEVVHL